MRIKPNPAQAELVEALSFFTSPAKEGQPFDKLRVSGFGVIVGGFGVSLSGLGGSELTGLRNPLPLPRNLL